MMKWVAYGIGFAAVFRISLFPAVGHALEYQLFAEVFEGLFIENNYLDTGSGSFDFEVNYNFFKQFFGAVFLFAASGDGSPETGNLNAFISPKPFNRRTAIFFNGGYERYDIAEAVMPGGVTWDGVISPGVRMKYQPHPKIVTEVTAAVMYPEGGLFDPDEWYGWEADIRLSWRFHQDHRLFLEAGRFTQGEFFKQKQGGRPDSATRFAAGARFLF